jgi:type IV secretion system protein VirB3
VEGTRRSRNGGLTADPLFVGLTRPALVGGVTYAAMLANGMVTVELFLLTKNLVWLLTCLPVHGLFWLVCAQEPRFFELVALWGKTSPWPKSQASRRWGTPTVAPLIVDLPAVNGRRCRRKP